MSQIERIFRIINLLESRQYVTMDQITHTCEIPRRTAYRYLNRLSEANIPLTYDRKHHGYTLNRRARDKVNNLDSHSISLIVLALESLRRRANGNYGGEITELITRLISGFDRGLSVLRGAFDSGFRNGHSLSDELTHSLLLLAAATESRIQVALESDRQITLRAPKYEFNSDWVLYAESQFGEIKLSRDEITHVRLIDND